MGFWTLNTAGSTALCTDRLALKAIDTTEQQTAYLMEGDRKGMFRFLSGNYSASVTADTMEGIYIKADDTASSAGAWVRDYVGRANVRWFGAKGDNSAADLPSLQAATDLVKSVFVPNGTYKTNGPWLLDDTTDILFESINALIKSSVTDNTSHIIRARGRSSTRNFYIRITGGMIQGPTPGGGVNGIDFLSTSYGLIEGTFISQVSDGINIGGAGSLGAFYNRMTDCIITDVGVGIRNGTLGNENMFRGCRIGTCSVGTDDDDNTCNTYVGCAIEVFSTGHRVCNTGVPSQRIRFIHSRLENVGSTGTGIDIKAAAQETVVIGEFFTGVSVGVQDGSASTDHLAAY